MAMMRAPELNGDDTMLKLLKSASDKLRSKRSSSSCAELKILQSQLICISSILSDFIFLIWRTWSPLTHHFCIQQSRTAFLYCYYFDFSDCILLSLLFLFAPTAGPCTKTPRSWPLQFLPSHTRNIVHTMWSIVRGSVVGPIVGSPRSVRQEISVKIVRLLKMKLSFYILGRL